MGDLIERLRDLLVQATTEKSHFYVAKCVRESINTIEQQQAQIERLRELQKRDIAAARIRILEAEIERLFASEQWLLAENAKLQAVVDAAKVITVNTHSNDIRGDCCLVKTEWLESLDEAIAALETDDD